METVEIKKDIYWVGARDWDIRDFHGYQVSKGSSYNAYLIMDEKITLVDSVKEAFTPEMLERIKTIVDPTKIDYLVCNHVEMDHSGALPELVKIAPNAVVVTDEQGVDALEHHYDIKEWNIKVVKTGDTINIGKRTLRFVQIPMLHWPDSMVTYVPEDKLLLSNDGFGQHIATDKLFARDQGLDEIYYLAKNYYANILYPFPKQTERALKAVTDIDIDVIAPAHGCVWQGKEEIQKIFSMYDSWAAGEHENKAVIVYDTMWGSTEKLAFSIKEELESHGIETVVRSLKEYHISDVMVDVIESKYVLVGTSTLNNQILPTVAAFLTYMKGLAPRNKIGFVFGSYGWIHGVTDCVQDVFKYLKWQTPLEPYTIKYRPKDEAIFELKEKIKALICCER